MRAAEGKGECVRLPGGMVWLLYAFGGRETGKREDWRGRGAVGLPSVDDVGVWASPFLSFILLFLGG